MLNVEINFTWINPNPGALLRMKQILPFVIVAVVGGVTLTSGLILYRLKRPAPNVTLKESPAERASSGHALGPANSPVTLEEFADFQCPPCGLLSEPLGKLSHDFPQLRFVFRNFPLPMHQHANEAARAAEAAGQQGRFWEMHDVLYREQPIWSKAPDALSLFSDYAESVGCNVEQFKKDMATGPVAARVETDRSEGARLGVKNTPTIFLNNTEISPANLNPPDLRAAIEKAFREKAPGPLRRAADQ